MMAKMDVTNDEIKYDMVDKINEHSTKLENGINKTKYKKYCNRVCCSIWD